MSTMVAIAATHVSTTMYHPSMGNCVALFGIRLDTISRMTVMFSSVFEPIEHFSARSKCAVVGENRPMRQRVVMRNDGMYSVIT